MPQGIQIFDEQGNIVLDTSTHTTCIFGKVVIDKEGDYSFTDSRFSWGTPFYMSDKVETLYTVNGRYNASTQTYHIQVASNIDKSKPIGTFTLYYGVF